MKNIPKIELPKIKNVFIVEDNTMFARLLEEFLKTKFGCINEVKVFPTGETCLLELYQNPSLVIIDHLLNTNHTEAATGLSILKKIKTASPDTELILLSGQKEFDVISKTITKYGCTYVQKDEHAFSKLEQLIKEKFQY